MSNVKRKIDVNDSANHFFIIYAQDLKKLSRDLFVTVFYLFYIDYTDKFSTNIR